MVWCLDFCWSCGRRNLKEDLALLVLGTQWRWFNFTQSWPLNFFSALTKLKDLHWLCIINWISSCTIKNLIYKIVFFILGVLILHFKFVSYASLLPNFIFIFICAHTYFTMCIFLILRYFLFFLQHMYLFSISTVHQFVWRKMDICLCHLLEEKNGYVLFD